LLHRPLVGLGYVQLRVWEPHDEARGLLPAVELLCHQAGVLAPPNVLRRPFSHVSHMNHTTKLLLAVHSFEHVAAKLDERFIRGAIGSRRRVDCRWKAKRTARVARQIPRGKHRSHVESSIILAILPLRAVFYHTHTLKHNRLEQALANLIAPASARSTANGRHVCVE
jgi:hypothetical protein